jgi:hypothetical protein
MQLHGLMTSRYNRLTGYDFVHCGFQTIGLATTNEQLTA